MYTYLKQIHHFGTSQMSEFMLFKYTDSSGHDMTLHDMWSGHVMTLHDIWSRHGGPYMS